MKNYLYIGALAVPLAIANQSGHEMNCEVRELACRHDPQLPHTPESLPISAGALTTHTSASSNGSGFHIGSGAIVEGSDIVSGSGATVYPATGAITVTTS